MNVPPARSIASLLAGLLIAGCAAPPKQVPIFNTVPSGRIIGWTGEAPVIRLYGTPYEIGYQHGSLMRREVRASVNNILSYADRQLKVPGLGRLIARRKLDQAWRLMKPHVPDRYLEELKGLSDGAGIPLRSLYQVHALPDLTSVVCANSAVAGAATTDGSLIHIRNLDWAIKSGVQGYSAIFVVESKGQRPFVNLGFLGFIGVLSGINRNGLSVGQIGAETVDTNLRGVPMPFLQRRVLEECEDLPAAARLIEKGPRTVGYNYLIADAKARSAVALETTRQNFAAYWMKGESLVRSDYALDPVVRALQLACKGDPSRPGLESPTGSSAYEVRYRGHEALLDRFKGKIDPEVAAAIAAAIAPSSNIQSVVYAYPQVWVAVARGKTPAARRTYRQLDLEELFSR